MRLYGKCNKSSFRGQFNQAVDMNYIHHRHWNMSSLWQVCIIWTTRWTAHTKSHALWYHFNRAIARKSNGIINLSFRLYIFISRFELDLKRMNGTSLTPYAQNKSAYRLILFDMHRVKTTAMHWSMHACDSVNSRPSIVSHNL